MIAVAELGESSCSDVWSAVSIEASHATSEPVEAYRTPECASTSVGTVLALRASVHV